ncbi:DNA translocase FtsK [Parafilimonas sp.]|uniref:DNA translocase FtsK n=1 Tax=Parafilimonas sp. TaxID=1969739 RepID=UPI0039E7131C
MANKLKKKNSKAPSAEKLNPDKEQDVTIKEVVKDERTSKIAGAVCLLVCAFLTLAFFSYFFTWQQDQDEVAAGLNVFVRNNVHVDNLLGVLGAYASNLFMNDGFGIASFLFCIFFFVLGVNLLFGKKIFNLARNLRYLIAGLIVLSVVFSFFFGRNFAWGGAAGDLMVDGLVRLIGNVGTAALLIVVFFAYIIWRFNPSFKLPERKPKQPGETIAAVQTTKENLFDEEYDNAYYTPGEAAVSINEKYAAGIKDGLTNNNRLRTDEAEDGNIVVIMPEANEGASTELNLIEKQETEAGPENNPPLIHIENFEAKGATPKDNLKKKLPPADVELEIKEIIPDDENTDVIIDPTVVNVDEPAACFKTPLVNYEPTLDLSNYKYPSLDLLEAHGSEKIVHDPAELEANKNQIISTLKNYDIQIQRISATVGPTVTLYEIVPAPGVRISRIKNLEDDIALSLAALGIRIIAPIPGKGTVGIEVPNVRKTVVSMKTLLSSEKFQNNNFSLPIAIGKKIDNENFIVDLATMPHLLMAGATGQGKSVGINTLLVSLLYKKHPSQLKLVLVDPKKVELSLYRVIERHFLAKLPGEEEPIITDTKKVVHTLNALATLMDIRYDLLKEASCRNIKEYNEKFVNRKLNPQKGHEFLPFIVLVIDEFADLIMTAGKEIEMPIARLAQLARAVGIHLIIATQRPSVNIITGTIKANFPARIAFKVSSKIDSRTILDTGGAEQLIGKGDMLISYNGEVTRLQCAFVDTPEVEQICEFIGDQLGYPQAYQLPEYADEKEMEGKNFDMNDKDPLFEDAARLIVQNQMGSTSLIQRRMKLGYNRAGRLMDQLEQAGVVGPNLGSKARDVLVKTDGELQELLDLMG